jgi:hypothetical protein
MRSFLLTVHEPGSLVLEDIRTRRRVRVTDLSEVPVRVAQWLAEPEPEPSLPASADTPDWTGSTSVRGPAL